MPRIAFALAALVLLTTPVQAQQRPLCAEHDSIVELLASTFGETLSAAGVSADGDMVQVYSADSGSWSVVITRPGGRACVIASGDGWAYERPEPPKPRGRVS